MSFDIFKERLNSSAIPVSYSYDVETDYLEWEGLNSRLSKYRSLLNSVS